MKQLLLSAILLLFSTSLLLTMPYFLNGADGVLSHKSVLQNQVLAQSSASSQVLSAVKVAPQSHNITPPTFTAWAVYAKDLDLGDELYAKDADKEVPIASTTKIMTAIIAERYYQQDSVLTVPNLSALGVIGSNMGLVSGEKITYRSLLYGLLLNSGNDAAFTLATNYPGGLNSFIDQMNLEASKLGLKNTHFDNPAGYDSPNHYSSAKDLATITELALENDQLSKVFATKETTVTSMDGKIVHHLENLNELLGKDGVIGVKTGTTPAAKENFIGLVERNGHRVLTVVLGSDDRFGETSALIDWIFQNYTWS